MLSLHYALPSWVMAAGGSSARALPGATACARQPQGRTLGYAVVGLGGYGLGRIVPEFANCAHSRLTGLVSGDRAKAERVAAEHGLPTRNIYDYANFDSDRKSTRLNSSH